MLVSVKCWRFLTHQIILKYLPREQPVLVLDHRARELGVIVNR